MLRGKFLLLFTEVVEISESVEDCGNGPSLSDARVVARLTMRVGELWETLPSVGHDMALMWKQPFHRLLGSFFLGVVVIKDQLSFEEESDWPNPFWTLMVVPTI